MPPGPRLRRLRRASGITASASARAPPFSESGRQDVVRRGRGEVGRQGQTGKGGGAVINPFTDFSLTPTFTYNV